MDAYRSPCLRLPTPFLLLGPCELIGKSPTRSENTNANMNPVAIYGDGRRFYRCLAAFKHQQLMLCKRNVFGIPDNQVLFTYETKLADEIRKCIANTLLESIDLLSDLPEAVAEAYLEDRAGQFFPNLLARVQNNFKTGAYAGTLEVATAAFVIRRQIHMFQLIDNHYKRLDIFPQKHYGGDRQPVCILHTPSDLSGNFGHFNLLLSRTVQENPFISDVTFDDK